MFWDLKVLFTPVPSRPDRVSFSLEARFRSAKNVAVLRILSPKRLKIQSADIFTGPPPENDTLSGWDGTGVNFWDVLEKLLVGVSVY